MVDPIFESAAFLAALLLGFILKNFVFKTDEKLRQAIPFFNLAAQFLGRLILEITPAEAGIFSSVGAVAQNILLESLVTTVLASGTQSSLKATGRTFLQILKQIGLVRSAEALSKAAGDPDQPRDN